MTPHVPAPLADERIDHRFKGLPPDAEGLTFAELAAERRSIFSGGFTTPLLCLDAEAVEHNLRLMQRWVSERGLAFAPHGKTTMAPQLFERQVAAGAWGITLAVPSQLRAAYAHGTRRVFLANEVVDRAALTWIARVLREDPGFELLCYVDSVRGVELMAAALRAAGATRPLDVVVELGGPGGRTGVRSTADAEAVADAVAKLAAGTLRLRGVAGYEAVFGPGTSTEGRAAVREWLRQLTGLARQFDAAGRFAELPQDVPVVVSAGGSEHFDAVAEILGTTPDGAGGDLPELSRPLLRLLRSGAYLAHDDGHYREVTPFAREAGSAGDALLPAMRLWAQVVSRPEPGLALLNAGKRDAPFDLDLPIPKAVRAEDGSEYPADGLTVTSLADQHAFLKVAPGARAQVGDWVRLGLSHPCTAFDKWQAIPLTSADGHVIDCLRTIF